MSLLGLVALLPGAAKKPDSPDVALTRAEEKITRLQTDLEVLERRILSLEAREATAASTARADDDAA